MQKKGHRYYHEIHVDPVFGMYQKKVERDFSKSRLTQIAPTIPVSTQTNWRLIYITSVITFLGSFEGAAIHMSEWPYMHQLDKEATVKFFGVAMSAAKAAHAMFVVVFSAWSLKYRTVKWPLITGRLIAIIACALYLCIEFIPSNRRYTLLLCYILFDISGSSAAILRAYITMISAPEDRSKAFATLSVSLVLSIITGPLIQMAFTTIPYPGITILPNLKFNVYSAPIWIAGSTNFLSIMVIFWGLKEPKKIKKVHDQLEKPETFSIWTFEGLKLKLQTLKKLDVNWPLIFVVWIAKCGKSMTVRSIATLLSIILMVEYGWSGIETIRVTSVLMGGAGVLSLFVIGCFLFCKLGVMVPSRFIYLFSIVIFTSLFAITYPYKSIGIPVSPFNSTDHTGCDTSKYPWCNGGIAPRLTVFLCSLVFVFGMTMPSASISLDTIYSKLLENVDQNLMQGAAVILDDIVLVGTPTYATYIYTHLGLKYLWVINASIMSFVVLLWVLMIRRFKFYS